MSIDSSLLVKAQIEPRMIVEIINALTDSRWSFDCDSEIWYLPLGDAGQYDWQTAPLASWPQVKRILNEKEKIGELIGLILIWGGLSGGQFLFPPERKQFSATWTRNRITLKECPRFTDHSWYVSRVIPPIISIGISIESIECRDL